MFEEADENADVDVEHKKPSMLALSKLATNTTATRQPIPQETPFMYRVYQLTVQRVPCTLQALNSHGSYVLVCDSETDVVVWIGARCEEGDSTFALTLGLDVVRRDMGFHEETEITVVIETKEKADSLGFFLGKLNSDEGQYRRKIARAARLDPLTNSPVLTGVLLREGYNFQFTKSGTTNVNESDGRVARVQFPEVEQNTVAVINVGNEWDLWVARGASSSDERDAKVWVQQQIASNMKDSGETVDADGVKSHMHLVRQGCERVLFRAMFKIFTDYEPMGKTVPYVAQNAPTSARAAMPTNRQVKFGAGRSEEPDKSVLDFFTTTEESAQLPSPPTSLKNSATSAEMKKNALSKVKTTKFATGAVDDSEAVQGFEETKTMDPVSVAPVRTYIRTHICAYIQCDIADSSEVFATRFHNLYSHMCSASDIVLFL